MSNPIIGRIKSYFEPLMLFTIASVCLPITLISHPLLLISSPASFRLKWFEKLWNVIGNMQANKPFQVPYTEEVMSRANGLVLEVGPGSGEQCFHLKPNQITKVYGAEPNQYLHAKLQEKAKAAGLEGKYIPLLAGGEPESLIPALQKQGVIPKGSSTLPDEGIFDCIIAVKVLCSIPRQHTAASLALYQRLLKPGGQFLFFEHVENNTDSFTQLIVSTFGWIWPWFTGGCHLDSKVDRIVLGMGGWSERRVRTIDEFQGYEIIRYCQGICMKE